MKTPVYLDFENGEIREVNPAESEPIVGVFPVNYVVVNGDDSDPGVYLGYGTWVSLGSAVVGATPVYYYQRTV